MGAAFTATPSLASANGGATNSLFTQFNEWMTNYEVKIRASVYNKQTFADPAAFQFTSPQDGGPDYWAVDIGATANLVRLFPGNPSDRLYFGPSVEYHKLTSTNKPQDNIQLGLNSLYELGYADRFPYAHILQLLPTYKNDKKGNGEGFLGRFEYLPVIPRLATGGFIRGPDWFQYEWQPVLGVQVETADKAGTPKRPGNEERFKAAAQVSLYPLGGKEYLNLRFQIIVGYTYWHAFSQSGGFEDLPRDNHLFKAGANYYIDQEKHVAIGVDYSDGANLEAGKPKQRILSAAFKLIY
jgi:hypothetical protein